MRLLFDTHIFYWSLYERGRLSSRTLEVIHGAEAIFISSASVWEIAIKVRLGKIKADLLQLTEHIEASGFQELPVFSRHAVLVADLPLFL